MKDGVGCKVCKATAEKQEETEAVSFTIEKWEHFSQDTTLPSLFLFFSTF